MSVLYEVYIVEISTQEVVYQDSVVAKNQEQAKMKVLTEALEGMAADAAKLTDYQFICNDIGQVNQPEKD